jgi:exosortase/archaeosortase family protein
MQAKSSFKRYAFQLASRIIIALILMLIPFNIFYFLFLKPTIYSAIPLYSGFIREIGDDFIILKYYKLNFVKACIASSAYYLLAILILLTKGIRIKKAFYIFLLGAFILFAGNLVRINFLMYILLSYGKNFFEGLHIIIWEFLSTIFVFLTWILLIRIFKIKKIPVYSDIEYLIFKIRGA